MRLVEEVTVAHNLCGEGPIWDSHRQRLWWMDLSGQVLFHLNPSTGAVGRFAMPYRSSAIALDNSGALLLAGPSGLHAWKGHALQSAALPGASQEPLPFNDLVADTHGRLYAGTLYLSDDGVDVLRTGHLFLIDPKGGHQIVDEGFSISNGLSLSPDGKTLYHVDSGVRRVYAYTVSPATGALSGKRVFVQLREEDGVPDGATVDAGGHVWCALWFTGKVARYDPEGRLQQTIELPVAQVSSLAFGGHSMRDLYITTASERWNSPLAPRSFANSQKPCGGSLYRIHLDQQGKLEHYVSFVDEAHCFEPAKVH